MQTLEQQIFISGIIGLIIGYLMMNEFYKENLQKIKDKTYEDPFQGKGAMIPNMPVRNTSNMISAAFSLGGRTGVMIGIFIITTLIIVFAFKEYFAFYITGFAISALVMVIIKEGVNLK